MDALKNTDKNLLTIVLVLLAFGWFMSFSASLGHFDSYSFAIKQLFYITLGLGLGVAILQVDTEFFKKHSFSLYVIGLVLLCLVFLPISGNTVNGSTRWINLIFFKFQPSEMMKITMILFMAGFLTRQENDLRKPWLGFIKTLLIIALAGVLLLLETDFGATIITSLSAIAMLFAAGAYLKQLGIFSTVFAILAGVLISLNQNRWERLTSFWQTDLWLNESARVHQSKQALIGIARGDWDGVGLGAGIQKYTKLPEPHTDMIFAVIGEELGIIGLLFVLFCFAFIIIKGFNIAKNALKNGKKYGSYVAFGICTWLSMQVGVNMAMNLALMPPKGFTLPLISYGGSSMIFSIIAIAFLLRIDLENRLTTKKYG